MFVFPPAILWSAFGAARYLAAPITPQSRLPRPAAHSPLRSDRIRRLCLLLLRPFIQSNQRRCSPHCLPFHPIQSTTRRTRRRCSPLASHDAADAAAHADRLRAVGSSAAGRPQRCFRPPTPFRDAPNSTSLLTAGPVEGCRVKRRQPAATLPGVHTTLLTRHPAAAAAGRADPQVCKLTRLMMHMISANMARQAVCFVWALRWVWSLLAPLWIFYLIFVLLDHGSTCKMACLQS